MAASQEYPAGRMKQGQRRYCSQSWEYEHLEHLVYPVGCMGTIKQDGNNRFLLDVQSSTPRLTLRHSVSVFSVQTPFRLIYGNRLTLSKEL